MPILNNPIDMRYEGKTQSQLVVSEGRAPAEKWLPSETTNATVQFNYAFGPENNTEVVIPKGKIVAAAGLEYDVVTEKYIPRIAISDADDIPMGVNHHNVYQRKRDKFSGNAPTIITRDYIRVPFFAAAGGTTAQDAANAIKFGAMWADVATTDKATMAAAIYGKYVVSDAYGNFCVPATLATDIAAGRIVGQVLGVEVDIPAAGYLEYFTEMTQAELDELIKQTREIPSPGRVKDSDLDIDTFPTGTGYLKSKEDLAYILKDFRQGIPFLTDGYFKARTDVTIATLASGSTLNTNLLDVVGQGNCTVNGDATKTITVTDPVGSALYIKFKYDIAQTVLATGEVVGDYPELGGSLDKLAITVGGVATTDYVIDRYNNMIVLYFTGTHTSEAVAITITLLKNQIPGIPTGWDFPGVFGEARILLQR